MNALGEREREDDRGGFGLYFQQSVCFIDGETFFFLLPFLVLLLEYKPPTTIIIIIIADALFE